MLDNHQHHRNRVEDALFTTPSGSSPLWLRDQASACAARYAGFRLIPEFCVALNAFSDELFKPFELFVVGEGKFGKSTLVNALLGEVRSKARGLPETRCFLRYVITDQPRQTSRMFLRPQRGVHDWLIREIGQGKPVPELYEIFEYEVNAELAREILETDARLMDGGNYEPAVYEAERDHKKTDRCIFPAGVRIVDTQGLDQLFPSDLQQLSRLHEGADITKRLMDWMSQTARGKHLEWQFRRCDAVLWCVNSKRIGSAATEASMRYFSAYSKKIVIALTNIDLVAKKPGDLEKLMEGAKRKYGSFATAIIPVNGQMALDACLSDDLDGMQVSGLIDLANTLTRVCVADGARTRAVSRYLGLRKTETQFRRALAQLNVGFEEASSKYDNDRKKTEQKFHKELDIFLAWLRPIVEAETEKTVSRIQEISLQDNRDSAAGKMGIDQMLSKLRMLVEERFLKQVIPELVNYVDHIKPYRLPIFDAEGERYGDKCSINLEIPSPRVPDLRLWFNVQLQDEIFDRGRLWLKEKWGRFFSSKMEQEAIQERQNLTHQRWDYVFTEFSNQWGKCLDSWGEELAERVVSLYGPVFEEFDSIIGRISEYEGEPIPATQKRIKQALTTRGAKVALHERLIAGFRLKIQSS